MFQLSHNSGLLRNPGGQCPPKVALATEGGGGGIRTPESLSTLPPFQGGALDRYATPPISF